MQCRSLPASLLVTWELRQRWKRCRGVVVKITDPFERKTLASLLIRLGSSLFVADSGEAAGGV